MSIALILVDLQKDFLPGGALGVPTGDQILPVINTLLELPFDWVVATGDWHPRGHCSFSSTYEAQVGEEILLPNGLTQVLWPDHCIQNTRGAEFAEALDLSKIDITLHKGSDLEIDSYSIFFDNGHLKDTGLGTILLGKGVTELYLAGLTTEYCIKFSALDAIQLGFKVNVVVDACKGINLKPTDAQEGLNAMRQAGAKLIEARECRLLVTQ